MDNSSLENTIPNISIFNRILKIKKLFYFLSFFISVIILCFYFFSAPNNFPIGSIIRIKQGESLRNVSSELKKENIIRSRIIFEAFVIFYGAELHINYTDYFLENKMPVYEIAKRIAKGQNHLAPIAVTIREGLNKEQIADIFSSKLFYFNKNNFLEKTKDLEGYLFPDTYFFSYSSNENDVIKSMRTNFNKISKTFSVDILNSQKTENDILTMASIIELEAKGNNDRNVISGILWKRISLGMPLQVDAVPETYKTKGLPKNPVDNPGVLAIKASIFPEKSEYLYYLHDKTGSVHYAKTFSEHLKNKIKYLSNK